MGNEGEPFQADGKLDEFLRSHKYTRRDVLKAGAGLAALATFGPAALAACGGASSSTGGSSSTPSGQPKKGGLLRVGLVGASTNDNLDAMIGITTGDECFIQQLYDTLVLYAPDQKSIVNRLAESVEPNSGGTAYMVKLKPGLVFHNGKSVTADDVIFSFQRQMDPKNPQVMASLLTPIIKSMKKVDKLTTQFNMTGPCSYFQDALAQWRCNIVPVGYQPKGASGAIGTGPWKIETFIPGTESVFVPNANYWSEGPYADKLTITAFQDPIALLNALLSNAVDYVTPITGEQAKVINTSKGYANVEAKTGAFICFDMNTTVKPYTDNRVRTAFKLICNRQQMIEQAWGGYGWVANDMYSPFDPGYPSLSEVPQRVPDIEQAKSLLKQAGYNNDLTVEMRTAEDVGAGAVEATQVFAQQAKAAGVTANVVKLPVGQIFGANFLKWPWAQDIYNTRNFIPQIAQTTLPTAPYNTTHWSNAKYLSMAQEAMRTLDATKRNELIVECQKLIWANDGRIITAFQNVVDARSTKVGGIQIQNFGHSSTNFTFHLMYFV